MKSGGEHTGECTLFVNVPAVGYLFITVQNVILITEHQRYNIVLVTLGNWETGQN